MKVRKKIAEMKEFFFKFSCFLSVLLLSHPAFCDSSEGDVVKQFMQQSLKGIFGSDAGFWKMFILADIALATVASLKSKNPMVFVGVFMTALVPGFLIKRYVFPST